MTDLITNADLTPILSADDQEFRALTKRFDPKCWAKYDLSAMRVGYHYGREPLLARIAELEAQVADLEEHQDVIEFECNNLREQIKRAGEQRCFNCGLLPQYDKEPK